MKYIKTFETTEWQKNIEKFKIGDYVFITNPYTHQIKDFHEGDRCKIISKEEDYPYLTIQNEDGVITEYKYDRVLTELEYNAKKYNL